MPLAAGPRGLRSGVCSFGGRAMSLTSTQISRIRRGLFCELHGVEARDVLGESFWPSASLGLKTSAWWEKLPVASVRG